MSGQGVSADLRPVLLRTVVGSRAFGTATEDSDWDYREVFYVPTAELLSLDRPPMKFAWQADHRGTDDQGGHEIAAWLHLVSKGAPNAIEMAFAPLDATWDDAQGLAWDVQRIGRSALGAKQLAEGAIGYAMNSFRKIPERPGKWKGSMLRVLYQARLALLGELKGLEVPHDGWGFAVRDAFADRLSAGDVYDECDRLAAELRDLVRDGCYLPHDASLVEANDWLLRFRMGHWDA